MDLRSRYAGSEAEIEPVERLDRGEAGDAGEHLAGPCPPCFPLGAQRLLQESAKEACFAAALWAMPEYKFGTAPSRNSRHSSAMR
jgi:hypothetical protein